MTNNGVGYIIGEWSSPALIYKGEGAPWSGFLNKVRYCYTGNYKDWTYAKEPPIFILYEGLIRWEDDQEV